MKPLFADSRRTRTTLRVVPPVAADSQTAAEYLPASAVSPAKEPKNHPSPEPPGLKHATTSCKTAASSSQKDTCDRTRLPTQQEIEKLAYYLYLGRGRKPGHEREDWLAAERHLRTTRAAE